MARPDATANLDRLMELVSPKVGVIRNVSRIQRGADQPNPPVIYQATVAHFDHRMAPARERQSAGKGVTDREAMAGAIGEALERYCAAHFNAQATRQLAWDAVKANAVSPPECVLYSERQYAQRGFPYHRWDPAETVTWSVARELPHGRNALVPASLVYLGIPGFRREDAFTPPTSNGLAAGADLERATLSGLCELVERDAFLVTWMARLPAPEVDVTALRGLVPSISAHYARHGVELRVFRLCTDLPMHAMMTIALDRTGTGPAAVAALACHLHPGLAIQKSLFEMCQVLPGENRRYREAPPAQRLRTPSDVKTLEDHSAYLTVRERMTEFSFLLENGRTVKAEDLTDHSTGDARADLDFCVAALGAAGCRIVCADVTTPDLRDYPIRVVRTIATGLQPLHFGYGEERLGGRRLFELPQKLGFASHVLSEADLNPCPHPLA
jgi:ribosomal protein S12 methylthiotransferase accessory factor